MSCLECHLRHARYGIIVFIFFGWLCMHSTKVSLVNPLMVMTVHNSSNASILTNDSSVIVGEFDWSEKQQSFLLSAYYIGQCIFLIPSGHMVELFGAHHVVLLAGTINMIFQYLTPVAARASYWVIYLVRVLLGGTAAAILPAFIAIISHTVPDTQKSISMAIMHVGGEVGQITTTLVSGYLCQYVSWESVFYFTGTISLIWLTNWMLFFPWVTSRVTMLSDLPNKVGRAKKAHPPLLVIFFNRVVLSVIYVKLCHMWFITVFILKFNRYTHDLLGLDLKQISILQTILQVVGLFSCLFMGGLCDYCIAKTSCSRTNIRKCFEALASFGTAALLALFIVLCCSKAPYYSTYIGMMLTHSGISGSIGPIVIDLSHDHAAILAAICQTMVTLVGWVTPPATNWLLDLGGSDPRARWNTVFYFTTGALASAGVVFTLFGSAEQIDFGWKPPNEAMTSSESCTPTKNSAISGTTVTPESVTQMQEKTDESYQAETKTHE